MTTETQAPDPAPLPCPFCGSTEGLHFGDGSTYRWGIASCKSCDASAGEVRRAYPDDSGWHADAIKAWNTRAAIPASEGAQADVMRKALAAIDALMAGAELDSDGEWGRICTPRNSAMDAGAAAADALRAALAAQPQAARSYLESNPLGGPAKVFRAMADAIEAGDSYEDTLRRYGYAETQAPAEAHEKVRAEALEEAAKALEPLKARWLPNVRDIYVVCECAATIRALVSQHQVAHQPLDIYDLKDRLVAASEAVADQDARSAQAILGETLKLLTKVAP